MAILRRLTSWIGSAGISLSRCDYNLRSACGRESGKVNEGVSPNMRPAVVDGDGELVGWSHNWAALFNKRTNDLFLTNPVCDQRIKLPPIQTLPDPDFNLDLDGHGSVSKVVLSCKPEDEDCRAMMTFGPANRLAFCLPGRSSAWTPIGDPFFEYDHHFPFERYARVHEDVVYCTRRKVFTSITACHLHFPHLLNDDYPFFYMNCHHKFPPEKWDWDIRDPASPKFVAPEEVYGTKDDEKWKKSRTRLWVGENRQVLENECLQIPHLVYAEQSDQLFIVIRFVRLMSSDGEPLGYVPSCGVKGLSLSGVRGKTFGFIVVEFKEETDSNGFHICTIEDDLNGMAMSVGIHESSAFAASSHQFNPNSIYFTDAKRLPRLCGADDTGFFDYATKTITTIPADKSSFKASPFYSWFG